MMRRDRDETVQLFVSSRLSPLITHLRCLNPNAIRFLAPLTAWSVVVAPTPSLEDDDLQCVIAAGGERAAASRENKRKPPTRYCISKKRELPQKRVTLYLACGRE